jgi:hypothetical protein
MEKQPQTFTGKGSSESFLGMNMERCPHFSDCSQNFCPLDPDLHLRSGGNQNKCRFMREPKTVKIRGREFVSGGTVMPDTLLNLVPRSNIERLNASTQARQEELMTNIEIK